jgi:tripartite-type tricarboxylate transporter receptor subunit TctC
MTQIHASVSAKSLLLAGSLAVAGAVLPGFSAAQDYPVKPVRIVVPFAAGGPNEIVARLVGQKLADAFGQPFIVESRPGAGGNIGTDFVAKAPADGYTLLSAGPGSLVINPLLGSVPYDTARDFAPVSLMATAPNVLVVHPSVPANSVKELIALARSRPGELNYASGGAGSTPHLAAALFTAMAGIRIAHVPYKGTGPAVTDLLGGQVQMAVLGIPTVLPHIRSGKLRALAVTGRRRSSQLPDVPTVDEAGVSGYEVSPWYGLLAPAATPREIVARLSAEVTRILHSAELREKLAAQGAEPANGTPEEFAAYLRVEAVRWAPVVRASGAKAD